MPEQPDRDDDNGQPALPARTDVDTTSDPPETPEGNDTPTISCTRCGRDWDLQYELDELAVGNQAIEQFALDHKRHTGHFPDDVTPWIADCRQCPDGDRFLEERSARRWARTHARHTLHTTALSHDSLDEAAVFEPEES